MKSRLKSAWRLSGHLPDACPEPLCVMLLAVIAGLPPRAASADEPPAAPRVDLYGDPLPEDATARMGTVRLNHGCEVLAFAYRGDGSEIISVAADRTLCVWDAAEGTLVSREPFDVLVNLPRSARLGHVELALSADGRRAALTTRGDVIRVFDLTTGANEVEMPSGDDGPARHFHFLGDGGRLLAVSTTGRVFNTATGDVLREFDPDGYAATAPAAGLAAMIVRPDRVRVFDVSTGKGAAELGPFTETGHVSAVAFSADATRLAVAFEPRLANADQNQPSPVCIYDIATKARVRQILRTGRAANHMFFSPAGNRLALVAPDKTSVHDTSDGQELCALTPRPRRGRECFSADGSVISALAGATIAQWDARTGVQLRPTHIGGAHSAAFSADGARLATAGDNTLRIWDAATGRQAVAAEGHSVVHGALHFVPSGEAIVAAHHDRVVVLDPSTLAAKLAMKLSERINSIDVSADGDTLAVGGERTVYLLDWRTGQTIAKWHPTFPKYEPAPVKERRRRHPIQITHLRFSPDGAWLVAQGADDERGGTVMFDVAARNQRQDWIRTWASSIAYSPDGALIAEAQGGCSLVDSKTGQVRSRLQDPSSATLTADFLANGELMLTSSLRLDDRRDAWSPKLQVWDIARRRVVARRVLDHTLGKRLTLSHDRGFLAVPRTDGTTLVVRLPDVARASFVPRPRRD
jgi:WD40 repeat protein